MKRYFALITVGLLCASAYQAKQCDPTCRQSCLANAEGDDCIEACGCETLANGVTMRFTEQQMCQKDCKQDCFARADHSEATLCSLTCASQCNQVCTFMCDFYGFGQECMKDCSLQLPKQNKKEVPATVTQEVTARENEPIVQESS